MKFKDKLKRISGLRVRAPFGLAKVYTYNDGRVGVIYDKGVSYSMDVEAYGLPLTLHHVGDGQTIIYYSEDDLNESE